jgi:hypothetical protein
MPKKFGTPGPRLIMPTVCTSVPVAGCGIEAQLLFDRLIAQADDQGRLQGEARVVAALCMPLIRSATERKVARWLGEIETAGLIERYQADGRELVQLRGWWDNQGAPRRAYPSRYPAPDGWTDRVRVDGEPPQQTDNHPAPNPQPADIPPPVRPQPADSSAADRGQLGGPRARGSVPPRPSPSLLDPSLPAAARPAEGEAVQGTNGRGGQVPLADLVTPEALAAAGRKP